MKKSTLAWAAGLLCSGVFAQTTIAYPVNEVTDDSVKIGIEGKTYSKKDGTISNTTHSGFYTKGEFTAIGVINTDKNGEVTDDTGIAVIPGKVFLIGDSHVDGNLQVSQDTELGGGLQVKGNAVIDGQLSANGLNVTGPTKLGKNGVMIHSADQYKLIASDPEQSIVSTEDRITTDRAHGNQQGTDLYLGSKAIEPEGQPVNVRVDQSQLIVTHPDTQREYNVAEQLATIDFNTIQHHERLNAINADLQAHQTQLKNHDERLGLIERDVGQINQRLTDLSKEASAGTASAIAHSYIAYPSLDEEGSFSIGTGHYNGQSAVALGIGAALTRQAAVKVGIAKDSYKTSFGTGFKYAW